MKEHPSGIRLIVIALLASTLPVLPITAADTGDASDCESRCRPLSGEALYKCIRTCLAAKKKSGGTAERRRVGSFKECEASCSSLTGLDQIRCIRTCMERGGGATGDPPERKPEKPAAVTACESRCGILTGDLKDACLARCKKEKFGEYRDPLRFKK